MSVTDPLIKKLKGLIVRMRMETEIITDEHVCLQAFCEILEAILRKGLKQPTFFLVINARDYWHWIEHINQNRLSGREGHVVSTIIKEVKKSKSVCNLSARAIRALHVTTTAQGKGRQFLRMAMHHKVLSVPIEILTEDLLYQENCYDPLLSIVGNDILSEIFKSLICEVKNINFKLAVKNASFLDDTWSLPVYQCYEFVPCRQLGLLLHIENGRAMAAEVYPGSVAEEDNKIEPGDILDYIQGECMRNVKVGKISSFMKQLEGVPLYINVIKCKRKDGGIYRPIADLIRESGIKVDLEVVPAPKETTTERPLHALLPEDIDDQLPIHNGDIQDKITYHVTYIGKQNVGPHGGVAHIDTAITEVLMRPAEDIKEQNVIMELGEKDVIVYDATTKKVIQTQSYTGISSCGHKIDSMIYFAFLAGETTCTMAKNFVGFVFKGRTLEESKTIICAIAQGFERTHWFV